MRRLRLPPFEAAGAAASPLPFLDIKVEFAGSAFGVLFNPNTDDAFSTTLAINVALLPFVPSIRSTLISFVVLVGAAPDEEPLATSSGSAVSALCSASTSPDAGLAGCWLLATGWLAAADAAVKFVTAADPLFTCTRFLLIPVALFDELLLDCVISLRVGAFSLLVISIYPS